MTNKETQTAHLLSATTPMISIYIISCFLLQHNLSLLWAPPPLLSAHGQCFSSHSTPSALCL